MIALDLGSFVAGNDIPPDTLAIVWGTKISLTGYAIVHTDMEGVVWFDDPFPEATFGRAVCERNRISAWRKIDRYDRM